MHCALWALAAIFVMLKNQEFRVFLWICIHRSCCKWNIARWKLFKRCGYQRVGLHMFYVIVWSVVSVVWGNKRWHRVRWRFIREEDRVYRVQSCKSDFARQFLTYGTKGNLLLVSKELLIVNLQNSFSIYQRREHCDLQGKLVFFQPRYSRIASQFSELWFGYVTSCVTCYVISNHMSFCYIDDSGNQMYLRVIAQPVLSDYSDVAERWETRSNRRVWLQ